MSSPLAQRLLGLLLGCMAACSHRNADGAGRAEGVTPATAAPGSVVTAEEISRAPGRPIEEVLMARFPGVIVTPTPDGGISVRIHGVGSFMSSNEPLYVIDDVPQPLAHGGALKGLNPYDIASIQVLKDPSETALYGVRGANGVIVIRTKRPGS
jgi:TonB-dependent SusC/RagA subfamily outer membrane receptor